ncbi:hypothetical protein AVEN_17607-1 [Araneus ventricosus]|uniref:Uncharacterized protein n=1 Tax=Araneus ventricosus TaxID=182803 RepID=A0A4Y2L9D6_ARAVE|nr:hypothetical protein AVEN_17607-1 [Araneus ventricosus]
MLIQSGSSQPGPVRGAVVLLEYSISMWMTVQHKWMEVIAQQLYIPNHIEGGKTCSPMGCIEQCYSHGSTAPEAHTVKRALHGPFTDCTTGVLIQLGGNLS